MSSFSIPRRRTLRFSLLPRRSTSPRTLSASTIRLTRLRLGHQPRRSRLPQNPLRQRLSRLLRSPNKHSFSPRFELRQNAPNFVGSVLFFRAPLRTHSSECCNTRVLRCEFSGSGIPSDRSVRFLNATALYHFSVAFFCSSVLLLWCIAFLQEYAIHTRQSPHHTKFLTASGIGCFPLAASVFQTAETGAARVVAVGLRIFCRDAVRCSFCAAIIAFF